MTIDASYWFSKAIDVGGGYTNTAAGDDTRNGISQSERLVQADLKGLSSFDQTHAFLVRWRYELPAIRTSYAVFNGWAKDWSISAVWLAKTGMPFTVLSGSDGPGFGNVDGSNGDRPNLLDASILGRAVSHPDTSLGLLPRNAFAYIHPGEERGNLGLNTFRRGGIANLNASVSRIFKLSSERSFTIRAETINGSNRAQFAEPNADLTSPAFGLITNTLNEGRTFQFTAQFQF